MALIAKDTGGADFDPIPAGSYEAVCYMVVDLGTHHSETFNKDTHKILVGWEVPDCTIIVDRHGKPTEMPRVISRRYTLSLHKKAGLRKDLEAWRGKAFTAEDLQGFNVGKLIGAPCLLGIVHQVRGEENKTYADVAAVMAMPRRAKGAAVLTPATETVLFSIPDGVDAGFPIPETIPEWIGKIIKDSKEWRGEMPWQTVADGGDNDASADPADLAAEGGADDLPF